MINKNVELDIPCPECGYKRRLKIKELETNPKYVCRNCKKTVNLDSSKFVKDLEATFENTKSELRKAIKKLNK
jgi:DNA-directed RNA polymerase subunit RPC12/RpoP